MAVIPEPVLKSYLRYLASYSDINLSKLDRGTQIEVYQEFLDGLENFNEYIELLLTDVPFFGNIVNFSIINFYCDALPDILDILRNRLTPEPGDSEGEIDNDLVLWGLPSDRFEVSVGDSIEVVAYRFNNPIYTLLAVAGDFISRSNTITVQRDGDNTRISSGSPQVALPLKICIDALDKIINFNPLKDVILRDPYIISAIVMLLQEKNYNDRAIDLLRYLLDNFDQQVICQVLTNSPRYLPIAEDISRIQDNSSYYQVNGIPNILKVKPNQVIWAEGRSFRFRSELPPIFYLFLNSGEQTAQAIVDFNRSCPRVVEAVTSEAVQSALERAKPEIVARYREVSDLYLPLLQADN